MVFYSDTFLRRKKIKDFQQGTWDKTLTLCDLLTMR
jgi:hypothetical protein